MYGRGPWAEEVGNASKQIDVVVQARDCTSTHAVRADLWELLAVWAGELGCAEVRERALARIASMGSHLGAASSRHADDDFGAEENAWLENGLGYQYAGTDTGKGPGLAGVWEAEEQRLSLMRLCRDNEVPCMLHSARGVWCGDLNVGMSLCVFLC